MRRPQDHALAFQHPCIAPPQRLGLTPGAVEQHDAFDVFQDRALVVLDLALAVDGDDISVGLQIGDFGRAEIEYGPARGIVNLPPSALERLGHDRPIFSTASLKCSAVSRAVPSALSCSCGCCRINSETLFSIGVMLS